MKKEKWINTIIFETGLFDFTILSDEEKIIIRKYLLDKKTPEQIAKKSALSVDEVKKTIRTGTEKILLVAKELLAKKIWHKKIQNELVTMRQRFKKELADKELTAKYKRLNIPVSNLSISTRAKNVLRTLNITSLNDLTNITRDRLMSARNAGPATVNEIIKKALEFGINIPDKKIWPSR